MEATDDLQQKSLEELQKIILQMQSELVHTKQELASKHKNRTKKSKNSATAKNPKTEIKLLLGAFEEEELLKTESVETYNRLNRVVVLIECFEMPYSMELLATVHWAATHDKVYIKDEDAIVKAAP